MKTPFKKLIATSSLALLLTSSLAAQSAYASDAQLLGSLLGAAGGAAIGSNIGKGNGRVAAIAVGTILGAGIGGSVASGNSHGGHRSYNHHRPQPRHGHHRSYYQSNYDYYYTSNPVYNNVDYIVPAQNTTITTTTYNVQNNTGSNNDYCREFTQTVNVGGTSQQSYGTACLQPDGSWKIQP